MEEGPLTSGGCFSSRCRHRSSRRQNTSLWPWDTTTKRRDMGKHMTQLVRILHGMPTEFTICTWCTQACCCTGVIQRGNTAALQVPLQSRKLFLTQDPNDTQSLSWKSYEGLTPSPIPSGSPSPTVQRCWNIQAWQTQELGKHRPCPKAPENHFSLL